MIEQFAFDFSKIDRFTINLCNDFLILLQVIFTSGALRKTKQSKKFETNLINIIKIFRRIPSVYATNGYSYNKISKT